MPARAERPVRRTLRWMTEYCATAMFLCAAGMLTAIAAAALAVNLLWSRIDSVGDALWSVLIAAVVTLGITVGELHRLPEGRVDGIAEQLVLDLVLAGVGNVGQAVRSASARS
jgi:hypothetical protein